MAEDYPKVTLEQIRVGDSIKVENSDGSALAVGYVQTIQPRALTRADGGFIGFSTADPDVGGLTWWAGRGDTYWRLAEAVEEPKPVEEPHWLVESKVGSIWEIPTEGWPGTAAYVETVKFMKQSPEQFLVEERNSAGPVSTGTMDLRNAVKLANLIMDHRKQLDRPIRPRVQWR